MQVPRGKNSGSEWRCVGLMVPMNFRRKTIHPSRRKTNPHKEQDVTDMSKSGNEEARLWRLSAEAGVTDRATEPGRSCPESERLETSWAVAMLVVASSVVGSSVVAPVTAAVVRQFVGIP